MQNPTSQKTIHQKIQEAVTTIQSRTSLRPEVGIILGSGLGSIAEGMEDSMTLPYSEIPHFRGTSIEGHAGKMILGKMKGIPVVFLQGRFHCYEGYPMEDVVFPTRMLCGLGIHTLILTNAAGAINSQFKPGDLMLIHDHINLMGDNPLKGPNVAELGPRFPDLSEAYSQACLETLKKTAAELEILVHQGVYVGVLGPNYETPAEIKMLRMLGADAVGMSTVPESITANHAGVRVAGISCMTNLAAGISPIKLSHQEVIETSKIGVSKIGKLLSAAIPRLSQLPHSAKEPTSS